LARCGAFASSPFLRYNELVMANERLDNLKRKRAQLNAKISKLSARALAQRRRDDTRRKIIAGALLLDAVDADRAAEKPTGIARWWDAKLIELKRPQDRALFELNPPGESAASIT
jgi:hypothetical protein